MRLCIASFIFNKLIIIKEGVQVSGGVETSKYRDSSSKAEEEEREK